jgi:1-aminocyclopropane-1-carboxylate deaminase/D-cysteine desulfhydrase-like pyridoxal-dependent ACC family enzyme
MKPRSKRSGLQAGSRLLDSIRCISGKGLAGLIALVSQGRWRKDEDVVFLHTGGVPALFAYQSALGI